MQDTIAAAREIDCGFAPHREQGGKGRQPGRMQDTIAAARDIVASNWGNDYGNQRQFEEDTGQIK